MNKVYILFSVLSCVRCGSIAPYNLIRLDPIEVTALGRVSKLGEFYDVRTDQFLHISIFKERPSNSSIVITQNRETKLDYTLENTFEEKFKKLDVSAELSLSILGNLVNLKGSGQYFKDIKTSAKSAKASLIQSISNVHEQVSLFDVSLQSKINFDLLSQIDATHVVVGIQWGGNIFVSVEDQNQDNNDVQTIQGNLGAKIQLFLGSISGNGKVNISDLDKASFNKFNFELYGNLVPNKVPQTIFEALEFMKISSELLLQPNKGKGKAIKYILLPLEGLKKLWNIKIDIQILANRIDQTTIHNCIKLFDYINSISQQINDVAVDVNKYQKYLSSNKIKVMKDLKRDFEMYSSKFSARMSHYLIKVRSGEAEISVLQNILQETMEHIVFWQKSNDYVLMKRRRENSFFDILRRENVELFDKDQLLANYLWQQSNKMVYVLFYTYNDNIMSDKSLSNLKAIIDSDTITNTSTIIAINYDFVSNDTTIAKWNKINKVCVYNNRKLVIDNFMMEDKNSNLWKGKNSIPKRGESRIWSPQEIQQRIVALEAKTNTLIPVGFIYVQFKNQAEPEKLWKNTKWQNVSPQYNSLFFRTEGNAAAPFGTVQESFAPSHYIDSYFSTNKIGMDKERCFNKTCQLAYNGWSDFIYTGRSGSQLRKGQGTYVTFYSRTTAGEVRPKNTAIKIWQRTQ